MITKKFPLFFSQFTNYNNANPLHEITDTEIVIYTSFLSNFLCIPIYSWTHPLYMNISYKPLYSSTICPSIPLSFFVRFLHSSSVGSYQPCLSCHIFYDFVNLWIYYCHHLYAFINTCVSFMTYPLVIPCNNAFCLLLLSSVCHCHYL